MEPPNSKSTKNKYLMKNLFPRPMPNIPLSNSAPAVNTNTVLSLALSLSLAPSQYLAYFLLADTSPNTYGTLTYDTGVPHAFIIINHLPNNQNHNIPTSIHTRLCFQFLGKLILVRHICIPHTDLHDSIHS